MPTDRLTKNDNKGWRSRCYNTLLDNSRYCANYTFDLHASDISSGELNTSPELGAYTPALFTSSSTRVLVLEPMRCSRLPRTTLKDLTHAVCDLSVTLDKWMFIFWSGFTLRCIQRLSITT